MKNKKEITVSELENVLSNALNKMYDNDMKRRKSNNVTKKEKKS
jgi:hypothetical protein